MHEELFSNAFQPPSVKVFGLALENYAIGHEMALIREGNPLATYGKISFEELSEDAKRLSLIMAMEICGKGKFLAKFRFTLAASQAKAAELDKGIESFRAYRSAGSQDLPQTKMPRQQGVPFRYFGAPGLASLINYVASNHSLLIQSHFGGSPLNFPLGLAQILYSTHLEATGSIWVKNQQEIDREAPRKPGTPAPGLNEKILVGEEAEKAFAEAAANANKGIK